MGTLLWSLTMIKSGLSYPFGIGFWGANGHDGVWHVALAKSLARGSLDMPTFAGAKLQNYHLGFDLLLALLHKLIQLPIEMLYFLFLPPILAFLIGLVVYKFVLLWKKSQSSALLSVFFVYFGGSLSWILGKGESAFWSQQSISTLINPPFALSLVVLFLGLIALLKKKKLLAFFLFGILIQIKAYAGVLALGGLFVSGVYEYFREKKFGLLIVFGGSLVLSIILFLPLNRSSAATLVFQPFWFLETLLGLSDRFYWPKLYEAMMNYKLGGIYYKLIPAYLVAFVIFVAGNFGTRLLGLKEIWENLWKRSLDSVSVFSYVVILGGIFFPMLFLQSGTPWNTIQFFYYSLMFLGVMAGISLSKLKKWVIVLVVFLTIPTTLITLKDVYLPNRPPAKISSLEVQALKVLEAKPNGIVLTYLFDEVKAKEAEKNPPRQLYVYVSSAYVSAYSNKPVYLEDEVNLDITGYDWRGRRKEVENLLKLTDPVEVKKFLQANNIKYLYLAKQLSPNPGELLKVGPEQTDLKNIFENSEVAIFEVQ